MARREIDTNAGLRVETAASIVARDTIKQYFAAFNFAVRTDRAAGRAVVAAFIDGLAGAMALTIAGKHGSRDEVVNETVTKLREAVQRDLSHLKAQ